MSDILVEVAEAVPVEVNLPAKDNAIEMEVYYQDEVSLDTDLSLLYIKSGEKEIENYVENVSKPEINNYTNEYAKPIVTQLVNDLAEPLVEEYVEGTVKPEISRFAAEEMSSYAEVATTQAGIATAAAVEANATSQSVDAKVAEFSEQTEASKQEFIALADEKTEEFEQTAQQAAADLQSNVEHARIWAEGEQAEVQPLGGELSSMGAADLAYALANAPEDTPIDTANMFAMNIFKGEKGDKGDKGEDGKDGLDTFATNCITEIPQDIKPEFNNGVLTLKAGSKVTFPDESTITLSSDKAFSGVSYSGPCFIFVHKVSQEMGVRAINQCATGTETPTAAISGIYHYLNVNTKKTYVWDSTNSVWVEVPLSFPICAVTLQASTPYIKSLDQVFNGFGYIGSIVFALPNVKGLIPNGRNADGSLKNTEFTVPKVYTRTSDYGSYQYHNFTIATTGIGISNHTLSEENYLYNAANTKTTDRYVAGDITFSQTAPYAITSFNPKLPFRAVDQNDFNKLDEEVTTLDAQNVKLTSNQTIGGVKTFTSDIIRKSTTVALSTTPSANTYVDYTTIDKNGVPLGLLEYRQLTNGSSGLSIVLRKKGSESSAVWERIGIFQDTNGNFYTAAPTPATSDNSTKMATTAWVNSRIVDYITSQSASSSSASGWRIWKSGLIEQWGAVTTNGTVTFAKAYKNTNYNLAISPAYTDGGTIATGGTNVNNRTTTGFHIFSRGDNGAEYSIVATWHAWGF